MPAPPGTSWSCVDERTHTEAPVAEPAPAPLQITPPVALSLQRTAGNAAVARLLAREPAAAPAAANPDRDRLNGIERKLGVVARNAQGRSDRINQASDGCVQSLKFAKDHLKSQGTNYKVGYAQFKAVLARADTKYESNKAIEDSVQGLLVAAAVAAIGPELLILKGAQVAARLMTASSTAAVTRVGVGAASAVAGGLDALAKAGKAAPRAVDAVGGTVGEGFEQVGGAITDGGKNAGNMGVGAKPSETAGSVASSGDKFELAFGQLDQMIDALPQLGESARSQVALAMAAQELGKEALRLAGGGQASFSLDEIVDKAIVLVADDMLAKADEQAVAAEQGLQRMLQAILRKPVMEPREIERKLWMTWMAGLGDPRVLDNPEIEKHLGPKGFGLIDFGEWFTFPWETRDAVTRAQRDLAQENTGANPTAPVAGTTPTAAPPPK